MLQSRLFQQGYSLLVMSRGIFVLQWQRAGQEKRECKALLNSNPLDMGENKCISSSIGIDCHEENCRVFCVLWHMRLKARTAWRCGGLKGLLWVWTVILLKDTDLCFGFCLPLVTGGWVTSASSLCMGDSDL